MSAGQQGGGVYQYSQAMLEGLTHWHAPVTKHIFAMPWVPDGFDRFAGKGWSVHRIPKTVLKDRKDFTPYLAENGIDVVESGFNRKAREYLAGRNIDLLFCPVPTTFGFECGIPFVMAIHDLQHRLQPEFPEVSCCGQWRHREVLFRNASRYAQAVLVDSETGKEDVIACYGSHIDADRVFPLPFIPSTGTTARVRDADIAAVIRKYRLPGHFIFYPAQFWQHKNHARLIHALHMNRVNHRLDIPIVLVGANKGLISEGRETVFNNMNTLAELLGVRDLVHYLGYVPDEDMAPLYAAATCLAMPTFFGPTNIPILEAWRYGCPVLSSDIRGVRDQVGDGGILVDPTSATAIAEAVMRFWQDDDLRRRTALAGRKRLALYTATDFQKRLFDIGDHVLNLLPSS
jgi:glycosyltransferase involved in cell wall biosynthesis